MKNGGRLNIPLYVRGATGGSSSAEEIKEAAEEWLTRTVNVQVEFDKLNSMLNGGANNADI
jgi:hypothetical protein